jgi:CheY-like chemotaxis protein
VSALRAGCDLHLTKPCPPAELLGAIDKLLAAKSQDQS